MITNKSPTGEPAGRLASASGSLIADPGLLHDDPVMPVDPHGLGPAIISPGLVLVPALMLSDIPATVQTVVMIAVGMTVMTVVGANGHAFSIPSSLGSLSNSFAASGISSAPALSGTPVHLHLPGGPSFELMADSAVAGKLASYLRRKSFTSLGAAPSWQGNR